MKKRKMIFVGVLVAGLACVTAAFCTAVPLGICALAAAIPVVYLGYKPLIPTPAPIWYIYNNHIKPKFCKKAAPSPQVKLGGYQEPIFGEFEADFYIAPNGSDGNDGSVNAPFATFERAKRAVRDTLDLSPIGTSLGYLYWCLVRTPNSPKLYLMSA